MKISKNTMLLGGAVVLGVLCFVGANYYLRSYLANAESRLQGSYKTKEVLVAREEVVAGGVINEDNLAVRTIPERYLASTVLSPDDLEHVSGQKVMVPLKPGDPIDRGALESGDRVALSTTVAKGERAITFPVDEISSINGMLVPGDIIDLIYSGSGVVPNSFTVPPETDGSPKQLAHVRMILQAVPVMATGKTTQKRVVKTEGGSEREVDVNFSTITLNVTPAQAEQVLMAQKLGSLSAVLRNPDDKVVLEKTLLDETTFKSLGSRPKNGANGRYLEMIVGGMGTPGGLRVRSEEAANPLAALLKNAAAQQQQAPAAAAPAAAPNAGDVRSRLGITPPATQTAANPFPLKK